MSKPDLDPAFEKSAEPRNQPAVCIQPTPEHQPEDLIRAILRAQTNGHQVMLAHSGVAPTTVITYAKRLGATVIDTEGASTKTASFQAKAAMEARDAGFPGVLWHENPVQRVDFEATHNALHETEDYVVDPVYESAIDTEPTVLVGIPAYNEAERIETVVTEASAHAEEVLVVDDGSTDTTSQVAADAGATVVTHEVNQGYGKALQTIFSESARSNTDHLVILDGDGQHDPRDIPRLVEEQRNTDADIVIGNRFGDGADTALPLYRRFGLAVVNQLTNLSLGVVRARSRVSDTQSGFRVYNRDVIASLAADDSINDSMAASTDILHHAHTHGYSIEEMGTTVDYDMTETSSRNPVSHGVHLVMNIVRTIEEQRPISAVGIPGLLSTLIGFGFAYFTLAIYIDSRVFPLGLALVSISFILAGIFACFTAIILHSLNTQLD